MTIKGGLTSQFGDQKNVNKFHTHHTIITKITIIYIISNLLTTITLENAFFDIYF
jgi:hypothetical protein